jgi:hypothetical protein
LDFEQVSLLKTIFYRKGAKSAKKINNAQRKVKSICERLQILNFIFRNLSGLRESAPPPYGGVRGDKVLFAVQ